MQPQYIPLSANAKDLTDSRYGRLVALGPVGRTPDRKILWLCRCDCGELTTVRGRALLTGNTSSCGCLAREETIARSTKHGMAYSLLHDAWRKMRQRCLNPSNRRYKDYGGRGIKIAPEWDSFKTFYEHVSSLPHFGEKGRSLDRIDNDGDYRPGNVRWATASEQNRNTRLHYGRSEKSP